jgi:hypothetical protein
MRIHLVPGFPAIMLVLRSRHGGQVLAVAVDADQPASLIRAIARPLLARPERAELGRCLTRHRRKR